ncbi:MAG TPA: hypothetical protein VNW49_15725, partial [Puia sp.]|nr:hypothetical protein [Puia sp.]
KHNISCKDPEVLSVIESVDSILRPTIQEKKLTGKIILYIHNERMHIGYENIKPVGFISVLMQLITASDGSRYFSNNVKRNFCGGIFLS